jgi:hypothetical protein
MDWHGRFERPPCPSPGGCEVFESGIITTDPEWIDPVMAQFDQVWMGKHCKKCKRKDFCPDPIVKPRLAQQN